MSEHASTPAYTLTAFETAHQGVTLTLERAGEVHTVTVLEGEFLAVATGKRGQTVMLLGEDVHTRVHVPSHLIRPLEQALRWPLELLDFLRLEEGVFVLEAVRPLSGERVTYQTHPREYLYVGGNFGLGYAVQDRSEHGYFRVFERDSSSTASYECYTRCLFSARFTSLELWERLRGPVPERPMPTV